jgi:hypothetical protein
VYIWADQVIQLVEDAVYDLDQQVALLVLQSRRHEQGQDLVEQGPRSKLPRLVCDLTQGSLRRDAMGLDWTVDFSVVRVTHQKDDGVKTIEIQYDTRVAYVINLHSS